MHRREFLKQTMTRAAGLWAAGGIFGAGRAARLPVSSDGDGTALRFGLVSDTHTHHRSSGHVNERHLRRQISSLNRWPRELDFVVHGGDCVNFGQYTAEWEAFLEQAGTLRAPWFLVSGNHDVDPRLDDPLETYREYGRRLNERIDSRPYAFEARGWRFVVIPYSRKRDRTQNREQAWLAEDLERHGDKPTVVFYHPHLFPVGIAIEYYCSKQPIKRGFLELLAAHPHVRYLFHGHVHNGLRTTQKLAWRYQGLRSVVLPTVVASRPFGERDLPPEWTSPAALVAEAEGDELRFWGLPSAVDAEAGVPDPVEVPIEFREFRPAEHPLLWGTVGELAVHPGPPGEALLGVAHQDWCYVPDRNELPPCERRPGAATLRIYGRGQSRPGDGPNFVSLFLRVPARPDSDRLTVRFVVEDQRRGTPGAPRRRRRPNSIDPVPTEGPVFWVQMTGLRGDEIVGSEFRAFTPGAASPAWFVGYLQRGTGGFFDLPVEGRTRPLPAAGTPTPVEIPYREFLAGLSARPDTIFLALGVGTSNRPGEHLTVTVDDWTLA